MATAMFAPLVDLAGIAGFTLGIALWLVYGLGIGDWRALIGLQTRG